MFFLVRLVQSKGLFYEKTTSWASSVQRDLVLVYWNEDVWSLRLLRSAGLANLAGFVAALIWFQLFHLILRIMDESASAESLAGLTRVSTSSNKYVSKNGLLSEEDSQKQIPLSPFGSSNNNTSRQKVLKTKPRGFDEETVASFSRCLQVDIQMEERIWGHLPEDLISEVLARVPPFYLFRLKSVCRRWNSILQDSSFLKLHCQVPSHGPCLLTFSRNSQSPHFSVFSLPLKSWHKLPSGFLPEWAYWLVGSSGGLACFSGFDGHCFKTLVCNPLTQQWRTLPSMHHNQQRQLIMVVDSQDKFFRIVAASDIFGDRTLPPEVYDSRLNSWSIHQSMPAVNLCSSKMAFCDNKIYLETLSPLGLMMYKMDMGCWEHIPAKFPRSLLDGYLVAGAQKRLFLVGRIGLYSTHQSMRIWELDNVKTAWVEIGRMPQKFFRLLLRLSPERFECFGQDNLICFTSWNQGKSLLYDVDKKTWSWISGCALQSWNSQVRILCWMSEKDAKQTRRIKLTDKNHGIGRWLHGLKVSDVTKPDIRRLQGLSKPGYCTKMQEL